MTARHDLTHRPTSVRDSPVPADSDVESTSTRVLLDGSPRTCHACDERIATGTRYKCLTVRDGDGSVSELQFCDVDCLAFHRRRGSRRGGDRASHRG